MMPFENWIGNGGASGFVIAIIMAEMLIVCLWMKGRAGPILLGLAPGLCLMLALRAAILSHGAVWIGLWITASLPFHIADLADRIKKARQLD